MVFCSWLGLIQNRIRICKIKKIDFFFSKITSVDQSEASIHWPIRTDYYLKGLWMVRWNWSWLSPGCPGCWPRTGPWRHWTPPPDQWEESIMGLRPMRGEYCCQSLVPNQNCPVPKYLLGLSVKEVSQVPIPNWDHSISRVASKSAWHRMTQRALSKHSDREHSESTQKAFRRHSENTWRAPREHSKIKRTITLHYAVGA